MTYLFIFLFSILSPTDSIKIKNSGTDSTKIELTSQKTDSTKTTTPTKPIKSILDKLEKKTENKNAIILSNQDRIEIQKQDSVTLINLLSVADQLANLPTDHQKQNELTLSLKTDLLHPNFLQTKVPIDSKGVKEEFYSLKTLSYYWVTHLPKRLKNENLVLKSPDNTNPIQSCQLLLQGDTVFSIIEVMMQYIDKNKEITDLYVQRSFKFINKKEGSTWNAQLVENSHRYLVNPVETLIVNNPNSTTALEIITWKWTKESIDSLKGKTFKAGSKVTIQPMSVVISSNSDAPKVDSTNLKKLGKREFYPIDSLQVELWGNGGNELEENWYRISSLDTSNIKKGEKGKFHLKLIDTLVQEMICSSYKFHINHPKNPSISLISDAFFIDGISAASRKRSYIKDVKVEVFSRRGESEKNKLVIEWESEGVSDVAIYVCKGDCEGKNRLVKITTEAGGNQKNTNRKEQELDDNFYAKKCYIKIEDIHNKEANAKSEMKYDVGTLPRIKRAIIKQKKKNNKNAIKGKK